MSALSLTISDLFSQINKNILKKEMIVRVKQEVSIHSKLKHPSILEMYTFFEDVNNVYMVLEMAQKGDLQRFLRDSQRVSGSPIAF